MFIKLSIKSAHVNKNLQNIYLKNYCNNFKYLIKNKLKCYLINIQLLKYTQSNKKFTLLSSPHINKKARDQYIFILYRKVIKQRVDLQYNNYIYHYIIIFFNMYLNRINKNFYNVLKLNYKYNYLIKKKNEDLHSTKKLIYRIMY
jgi:hypothetical protein